MGRRGAVGDRLEEEEGFRKDVWRLGEPHGVFEKENTTATPVITEHPGPAAKPDHLVIIQAQSSLPTQSAAPAALPPGSLL